MLNLWIIRGFGLALGKRLSGQEQTNNTFARVKELDVKHRTGHCERTGCQRKANNSCCGIAGWRRYRALHLKV